MRPSPPSCVCRARAPRLPPAQAPSPTRPPGEDRPLARAQLLCHESRRGPGSGVCSPDWRDCEVSHRLPILLIGDSWGEARGSGAIVTSTTRPVAVNCGDELPHTREAGSPQPAARGGATLSPEAPGQGPSCPSQPLQRPQPRVPLGLWTQCPSLPPRSRGLCRASRFPLLIRTSGPVGLGPPGSSVPAREVTEQRQVTALPWRGEQRLGGPGRPQGRWGQGPLLWAPVPA